MISVGDKFGRLTVISRTSNIGNYRAWFCRCECGTIKAVRGTDLNRHAVKSCGCLRHEHRKPKKNIFPSTHPLYRAWQNMKTRCYNRNCQDYENYGGRGIYICSMWLHDFNAFATWATENGWGYGLQIDRIDNDREYSPDNCRWVTQLTNMRNRRPKREPYNRRRI